MIEIYRIRTNAFLYNILANLTILKFTSHLVDTRGFIFHNLCSPDKEKGRINL